ncbi:hypothetical protein JW933_08930, partial [candidate division FCPU426 bacterium]|nr:hypothetical protein [candidate division FCPU426 bacterium]
YVYGYTAAGAGMGAVGGVFFAMFVWALSIPGGGEVENFYQGSTGAGIGALVGATLGLGAAIVQFNLHPPAEAANITLTLEVQPHLYRLAEQPQALPQLLWACTMIEIDF